MKRPKLEDYGDITYSQYMNDVDEYVNELQAEVADLEKENEQLKHRINQLTAELEFGVCNECQEVDCECPTITDKKQ